MAIEYIEKNRRRKPTTAELRKADSLQVGLRRLTKRRTLGFSKPPLKSRLTLSLALALTVSLSLLLSKSESTAAASSFDGGCYKSSVAIGGKWQ